MEVGDWRSKVGGWRLNEEEESSRGRWVRVTRVKRERKESKSL